MITYIGAKINKRSHEKFKLHGKSELQLNATLVTEIIRQEYIKNHLSRLVKFLTQFKIS